MMPILPLAQVQVIPGSPRSRSAGQDASWLPSGKQAHLYMDVLAPKLRPTTMRPWRTRIISYSWRVFSMKAGRACRGRGDRPEPHCRVHADM